MKNKIPFLLSACWFGSLLNAQVIFQDNFNYTDPFTNHGWSSASSHSAIAAGAGPDGSNALKITFNGEGNRWHDWAPATQTVKEVWVTFNYKLDCGSGSCKGGGKWLKIFGGNYKYACNSSYPNASLGTWGGSSYNGVFDVMQYGGSADNAICMDVGKNISVEVDARDNKWHTFKLHARYNDNGQSNGVYQIWHDGVLKVNQSGVVNRSSGAPNYIGAIELGGWNQSYGGTPYYYYYDNFFVSTTDPGSGGPSCGGPDPWTNSSFTQQTGSFTADFDVIPSGNNVDGVVGLSNAAAATYTDLACIVRFNTNGNIDARNGSSYQAANTVSYLAGISYHVKMNVNLNTKKYDVYVTPQGSSQQTLASQYDFRTEQNTIIQLNNWAKNTASCSLDVKNFTSGITTSVKADLNNMFLPFTVYPNPFSEFTTLDFTGIKKSSGDNLGFYLYNLLGEEVVAYSISTDEFILERNNLDKGVYLYKALLNEKYIGLGKLIIQ